MRENRHVIFYSSALRFCVIGYAILVTVLLAYCFLAVSLLKGPYTIRPIELFSGIAVLTALFVTPVLFHVFRTRIEYDSACVYTFTPWRDNRTIPWNEIVRYSFSRMLGQHILSTKGGDEIRFGVLLSGYEDFLNEARRREIAGLSDRR